MQKTADRSNNHTSENNSGSSGIWSDKSIKYEKKPL